MQTHVSTRAKLAGHSSCRTVRVTAAAAPEKASGTTSLQRNPHLGKLAAGYLFPTIAKKKRERQEENPEADLISLGIGDTTEPIPQLIADSIAIAGKGLATPEGFSGYGPEQGQMRLREAIASRMYNKMVEPSEVFVSDGSKCDIARMQILFGSGRTIAVQDPAYPAYVDTSVMAGHASGWDETSQSYSGIRYMQCTPSNGFFPDLNDAKDAEIIFFCSPNNPTGYAATKQQLQQLVDFCKQQGSLLVFDAAYAFYIEDEDCPTSIFEIPGAREVAIETQSLSKYAGFTGVRLGWTVVPHELTYADGTPVNQDWNRIMGTCFNGASNVVQEGGMTCMSDDGFQAMRDTVAYYKENARMLTQCFHELGFEVHGGRNCPYIWVLYQGRDSWTVFEELLRNTDIVTTPGSGFGSGGEGAVRVSAFQNRGRVQEAIRRLKAYYNGGNGN